MNELIPIFEVDGVPVTTSRAVAEQFGKRHDNVIQAIENILNSKSEKVNVFTALNFKVSEYTDISGKTNKQYLMTRDGFALLAMGFTGEKALEFKVAYINAFNRMEQLIKGGGKRSEILPETLNGLKLIEETAGAGQNDIVSLILSDTCRALEEAINGGEYALYKKFSPGNTTGAGTVIGSYNDYTVKIQATALYNLYAAYSSAPVRYTVWRELMQRSNERVIFSRGKGGANPTTVKFARNLVRLNI